MRILIFALLLGVGTWSQGAEVLLVIVHPNVATQHLNTRQLKAIYLLNRTNWSDGQPIVPLNLSTRHPWRRLFFDKVLKIPMETVIEHWLRMRFRGRQPPYILASPEAVVAFVKKIPGAIGYVPAGIDTTGTRIAARFNFGNTP